MSLLLMHRYTRKCGQSQMRRRRWSVRKIRSGRKIHTLQYKCRVKKNVLKKFSIFSRLESVKKVIVFSTFLTECACRVHGNVPIEQLSFSTVSVLMMRRNRRRHRLLLLLESYLVASTHIALPDDLSAAR